MLHDMWLFLRSPPTQLHLSNSGLSDLFYLSLGAVLGLGTARQLGTVPPAAGRPLSEWWYGTAALSTHGGFDTDTLSPVCHGAGVRAKTCV